MDSDSREDKAGFDLSAIRVNKLIQYELDKGILPNNIVIGGFSQGGALALHVSLRSTYKLGGCIALSTWLPLHKEYPAALSNIAVNLPILQVHGDEDMVVSHQWGRSSHDLLKTFITTPSPTFITIEVYYILLRVLYHIFLYYMHFFYLHAYTKLILILYTIDALTGYGSL